MDFLEYIKKWLHGEGVALGLLAQLVYNGEDNQVEELKRLMKEYVSRTVVNFIDSSLKRKLIT